MSKHNYSQYSKKPNNPSNKQPNGQYKPPATKPADESENETVITGTIVGDVEVNTAPVVTEAPKLEPAQVKMVEGTVETVALPKVVEGVVTCCTKLNVRAEPNLFAKIVGVLDVNSKIEINVAQSDSDWFKICTITGIEGYCMRRFVEACL